MKLSFLIAAFALSAAPAPAARAQTQTPTATCPAASELQSLLAQAGSSIESGNFTAAADALRPNAVCDPRVALLLAGALDAGGDRLAAEQALESANRLWPQNTSLAASLARYKLAAGQSEQAAALLALCRPDASTPLPELQVFTVTYLSAHQLLRAQGTAELAFRTYPAEQTLLLLANTLQLQGRYQDVTSLLAKYRAVYGNSAGFLITAAESEFDSSDFLLAQRDLVKAVSLDSNSYPARYLLGNTLFRLGKLDEAIGEYRAAIALNPRQPRTFQQLALAQEAQQDTAAAQQSLGKALELNPCYAAAYTESGKILLHDRQPAKAAEQLNAAVRCDSGFEQAWYLLVQAYARLGEKEQSAQAQQTWLALKNAHKLQPAPAAARP